MTALEFTPDDAVVLIVDVQERLASAMKGKRMQRVIRNIGILCEMAKHFDIPVVVSEQYRKGLGPTVAAIEEALAGLSSVARIDKLEFSVCKSQAFENRATTGPRAQWIVAGMESHVCVYQTVRDLRASGMSVHVPADAVISRTGDNRKVGLRLMEQAGAVITSTETLVFDALQVAGTDKFRALSTHIR